MGGAPRGHRTALVLWLVPPLCELPVVAMLAVGFDEVARIAAFGRAGTLVVVLAALLLTVVGGVVAWRPDWPGRSVRVSVAALLFVAAGLLAVLMLGFFSNGSYVVVGLLVAHAVVCVAMLARSVLRVAPRSVQLDAR